MRSGSPQRLFRFDDDDQEKSTLFWSMNFCIKRVGTSSPTLSPGPSQILLIHLSSAFFYSAMSASAKQFLLPDLRASCQLKSGTNPHYKQASAASRAWINSYDIFTDRKRAFFVQGCNELLCSFVYPYANLEQLRTACDFVCLSITAC